MKVKTTRKQIENYFGKNNVFYAGYCDLQYITQYTEARFYNKGIYGWNFDAYVIGNKVIVTGYRNLFGKRINIDLIKKYSEIIKDFHKKSMSYNEHLNGEFELIQEMLKEVH